jgi:TPR repeat protein
MGQAVAVPAGAEEPTLSSGVQRDLEEALRWLRRSADRGHVDAMVSLGSALLTWGNGTTAEGVYWLRRAADAGSADGMFILASCLDDSAPQSAMTEVAYWYRRSARNGHPNAGYYLRRLLVRAPHLRLPEDAALERDQVDFKLGSSAKNRP